jgi:RimJ/RimL family protein N-acetyltransferase
MQFRAIGDGELAEIARRQSACLPDLSELFDNKPSWAPLSLEQVREHIAAELKKPHTAVFAIHSGQDFVGIGEWSASWDSWSPYAWFIIWPEHRRKGLGTKAARMLLDKCFMENPGRSVVTAMADGNTNAARFVRALGFREAGRMRRTHMVEGKFKDTLFFDMLKAEYSGGRRGARR